MATTANPMIAPTIVCVVDTGQPNLDATVSQAAAARSADNMPMTSRSGSCWRDSASMMPLRIVEVTSPPARNAPRNSKTPAIRMAPPTVRAPAPTDVPIEFATSLAPIAPRHVEAGADRRDQNDGEVRIHGCRFPGRRGDRIARRRRLSSGRLEHTGGRRGGTTGCRTGTRCCVRHPSRPECPRAGMSRLAANIALATSTMAGARPERPIPAIRTVRRRPRRLRSPTPPRPSARVSPPCGARRRRE